MRRQDIGVYEMLKCYEELPVFLKVHVLLRPQLLSLALSVCASRLEAVLGRRSAEQRSD